MNIEKNFDISSVLAESDMPIDSIVKKIWCEVLSIKAERGNLNFFKLGGNSLSAVLITAKLSKELKISIDSNLLLNNSDFETFVLEIKSFCKNKKKQLGEIEVFKKKTLPRQYVPATDSQKMMWVHDKTKMEGDSSYNELIVLSMLGEPDVKNLNSAINQVISNNQALRTRFEEKGEEVIQYVEERCDLDLEIVEQSESEVSLTIKNQLNTAFDLSKAPLIKAKMYRINRGKFYLVIVFHHIIMDGWSEKLFIEQLRGYYLQNENTVDRTSFLDYVSEYSLSADDRAVKIDKEFWTSYLSGSQKFEFPSVYTKLASRIDNEVVEFQVDASCSKKIRNFSKELLTTPFMVSLSIFVVAISKHFQCRDFCVGIPVLNRDMRRYASTIGCFVNTMPLRINLKNCSDFKDVVDIVKASYMAIISHQQEPFASIVNELSLGGGYKDNPIFELMFVYRTKEELEVGCWPDLNVSRENFCSKQSKFKLSMTLSECDNFLDGFLHFQSDIVLQETGKLLCQIYVDLIGSLELDMNISLDAELLNFDTGNLKALYNYNEKCCQKSSESISVVENIKKHVQLSPEAVALVCNGNSVTYKDVNDLSDKLALFVKKLAEKKSKNSTSEFCVVALCLNRSVDLVVAILAALKAGVVFVPIDRRYPPERVKHILEDSCSQFLICNEATQKVLADLESSFLVKYEDVVRKDSVKSESVLPLVSKNSPAYLIYTSGSTGLPKGVLCTHRGLETTFSGLQEISPVKKGEAVLFRAPIVFDVSLREFLLPLTQGAMVIVADDESYSNPREICSLITRYNVVRAGFVPVILNEILEGIDDGELSSLKTVFCGGDKLEETLIEKFEEKIPNATLFNSYGPTEITITSSVWDTSTGGMGKKVSIGTPMPGFGYHILDRNKNLLPPGAIGELYISGDGLARGYWNNKKLTGEKFQRIKLDDSNELVCYRTGDKVCYHPDGTLEYLGRFDNQVKIRGLRIELGEIETSINDALSGLASCVLVDGDYDEDKVLVAYVLESYEFDRDELQRRLSAKLPDYMLPNVYKNIAKFPLLSSGKIDRKSLSELKANISQSESMKTKAEWGEEEATIREIWSKVLKVKYLSSSVSFFEAGGNSLKLIRAFNLLVVHYSYIKISDLFKFPTISGLASYIRSQKNSKSIKPGKKFYRSTKKTETSCDVAIIGMSAEFSSCRNISEFFEVLREGKDTIFRENKSDDKKAKNNTYIAAHGRLLNFDMFDADFFNLSPREAEVMDPQQRRMLQVGYHALEDSGFNFNADNSVGVYLGASQNSYLQNFVLNNEEVLKKVGLQQVMANNNKLATLLSFKLNLKGPSVNINTACSSSLVAVHMAVSGLLNQDCDVALTGGASILCQEELGCEYQRDGIISRDGVCRPFDRNASGTVGGDGVGVVVLKRLQDAIRDKNKIYAVIKGTAVNNDGRDKVGFTAPSVVGQVDVISKAIRKAGLVPEQISYIEAHGTGTKLGDPIEIDALKEAFLTTNEVKMQCAIGAVKSNIGHLDAASGIAGLIKTVIMLNTKKLFPAAHFQKLNPAIDLEHTPFSISNKYTEWKSEDVRYAGVSSFGIGGTNAHVVLGEHVNVSEVRSNKKVSENEYMICLSSDNPQSLHQKIKLLEKSGYLSKQTNLLNLSLTLYKHKAHFSYRKAFVVQDYQDLKNQLKTYDQEECKRTFNKPKMIFLFPGQGAQYVGMGRELYERFEVFRDSLERCRDILIETLNLDIIDLLYNQESETGFIDETHITQPLLFSFEYSLAILLRSLGIEPDVMVGHSLGEYVAACLSGIFTLEDALFLVAERGRLCEKTEEGAMLVVYSSQDRIEEKLSKTVNIAAFNSQNQVVLSGGKREIINIANALEKQDIKTRLIQTRYGFHSNIMDAITSEFSMLAEKVSMKKSTVPFVSNVYAKPTTAFQIKNNYWVEHLKSPVQFYESIRSLSDICEGIFVEVGPGHTLTNFARQTLSAKSNNFQFISLLKGKNKLTDENMKFSQGIASLWESGVAVALDKYTKGSDYEVVPTPFHPFQEKTYWVNKDKQEFSSDGSDEITAVNDISDDFSDSEFEDGLQEILAKKLIELSGFGNLSASTDFFEIGMHSLMATQYVAKLIEDLDVDIGVDDIFNYPTVSKLSNYIYRLAAANLS